MEAKAEKVKAVVSSPRSTLRQVEVEVVWEEVSREWEKILDSYVRRARLDGFRPGKAPRELVKRLFSREIQDDLIETFLPRVVKEVMRENNITPLTNPVVSDILFRDGKPLRFRVRVEILPEFKLPEYRKIRVRKKEVKVEPNEVEASLERLRQDSAEYLPVQGRGVVEGDYVVLDWTARDVRTRRALPRERVLVIAGHPENGPGWNEALAGLKSEESRRFTTSYPDDYPDKKLAGRTLENEIKLISIKEKKVPELTDEWARDLGEFEDLAALRDRVRRELEKSKAEEARQAMGEEVVETLLQNLDLELPEKLVEEEMASLLRAWLPEGGRGGTAEVELDNLRQRAREEATKRIKKSLVLRRIAEKEGLTVTEEEVDEEIRSLAQRNNVPVARLVDQINREGRRGELKASLVLRRAIDFLLENAVIY